MPDRTIPPASSPPRTGRRRSGWLAAALAAVTAGTVTALVLVAPSSRSAFGSIPAAPAASPAAATASTATGTTTLDISPSGGLAAAGSTLTVSGTGYDPASTLLVAVCAADGKAPAALTECMGGAVPDANQSKAWGYITPAGAAPAKGGSVPAAWSAGGAFAVTLTLPGAAGSAVDCLHAACSVFAVVSGAATGLSLPITFATPTTPPTTASSSTTSSSTPTTSSTVTTSSSPPPSPSPSPTPTTTTSSTPPSTVSPKAVQSSVQIGATQEVLFAGFRPRETVDVTLFSNPITLPPVFADADGIVKIDFKVPAQLNPGTHQIQAIGRTSRTVGLAVFTVTAAPVPTSASASPRPSPSPSPSASAAPSTAASSAAASSAPVSASSAAPSSAVPVITPAGTGSGKPVWPWFVLGIIALLLVISVVIGLVTLSRRRAQLERENADRNQALAMAAAEEAHRAAAAADAANAEAPTTLLPPLPPSPPRPPRSDMPPGYESNQHGLLSGHGSDDPGVDPEPPTRFISGTGPDQPTQAWNQPGQPGQPTQAWTPPGQETQWTPPAPETQAWTPPDEDDPPPAGKHRG